MADYQRDNFLDELRSRVDIVDYISGHVPLKQKGSKFWGCCPFHMEKTPSFSVDRQKQMYYCFGCHKGGDIFKFVMETERLEFWEAVEQLAGSVGLEMPKRNSYKGASTQRKERAVEACTYAARYFRSLLNSPEGEKARAYIAKRQISEQSVRRFGMGLSPSGWDTLSLDMLKNGFTKEELTDAGLSVERNGKLYDMFRGRVMFPIINTRGQVIAFGGRIMNDEQPKYLNTGDTIIFNKRVNLFGIHMLKGLRELKTIFLVEGYIDVVSLVSHGVPGCLATLGTAITPEQARLMKRYASDIVICYDGDEPGQKAAVRAIGILKNEGIEPSVISIPGGQDPDDFIKANGAQAFMELKRTKAVQFLLDREKKQCDMSLEEGRSKYAMAACAVLKQVTQPVVLENYIKQLMVDTGYSREVLMRQIGVSAAPQPLETPPVPREEPQKARQRAQDLKLPHIKAQRQLIALMASGVKLPNGLLSANDFTREDLKETARLLLSGMSAPQVLSEFREEPEKEAEAARIFSELEEITPELIPKAVSDYVDTIRLFKVQSRLDELRGKAQSDRETLLEMIKLTQMERELKDRMGK